MIQLLLEKGANANTSTHFNTPLHSAAEQGRKAVVRLLIQHGADINARTLSNDKTALIVASQKRHTKTVELLLEHGADPNVECEEGTALIIASSYGHLPIMQLLLDRGARLIPNANDDGAKVNAVLNPNQLRNALDQISVLDDVSKTYEDIFARIKNPVYTEDKALALKTLSWVVGAERPLTAQELLNALAITSSRSKIDVGDLKDWERLQNITFGLIVNGGGKLGVDPHHTLVSFVHQTAHEFFVKKLATATLATDMLTDTLTYLNFPSLAEPCRGDREDEEIKKRLKSLPFAAYACQYVSILYHAISSYSRFTHDSRAYPVANCISSCEY